MLKLNLLKLCLILLFTFFFAVSYSYLVFYKEQTVNLQYLENDINSVEIVIARYNEDLSWLKENFRDQKVIIYNKGTDDINLPDNNYSIIKLPNIGRESHTYLYYIINNYNNLPERVIFLQGDPINNFFTELVFSLSDYQKIRKTNCENIIAWSCRTFNVERENKILSDISQSKWHNTNYKNHNFKAFLIDYILGSDTLKKEYKYSPGANFAVDREKILSRELEYYIKIFNTLDNISPIEGHFLERSWDIIFEEKNGE